MKKENYHKYKIFILAFFLIFNIVYFAIRFGMTITSYPNADNLLSMFVGSAFKAVADTAILDILFFSIIYIIVYVPLLFYKIIDKRISKTIDEKEVKNDKH